MFFLHTYLARRLTFEPSTHPQVERARKNEDDLNEKGLRSQTVERDLRANLTDVENTLLSCAPAGCGVSFVGGCQVVCGIFFGW